MPEYRVNQIEDVLRSLHQTVEGLQGTVVVSLDGFVVAAYLPSGNGRRRRVEHLVDSPQVAAMAASIIAISDKVLAQLARGSISRVLIDGSEGGIVVVPAGSEAALAAMVGQNAKWGIIMLALRRSADQVQRILARADLSARARE